MPTTRWERQRRRDLTTLTLYTALGLLGALGGARPTGMGWSDAVLLGLGGAAVAACGFRARTTPIYVAAATAALCQPAAAPLALACLALATAASRRFLGHKALLGATASGLAWAATVGAPFEPGAVPAVVPLAATAWVVVSARQNGQPRFRRRFTRVALAILGLTIVGVGLCATSLARSRADVERGVDLAQSGLAAARGGDTAVAMADLRAGQRALARGESSLGALWARPAWVIPGLSQNARALHALVAEAGDLAAVGAVTTQAADLDKLRAGAGQVDMVAVAAVGEPLEEALGQLRVTRARLDEVADLWLVAPVEERVEQLQTELAEAIPSAELALQGAEVAPALLGADGPRTYLVLFTTPAEARGRTGFPGNFAEVTFTDGRFEMTRFGRLQELDPAPGAPPRTVRGPADFLARYARFGADRNWRNLTMSPDFPTIAAVAAELYPQSGGVPVDGVLSVDPVALAALLRFTGPITVPGAPVELDSANAAQFLLEDQYIRLPDNPQRIDALGLLAEATFDRLTEVDLPGPRALSQILGPVVEEGHLQLMTFGDREGPFLDQLGMSGRLGPVQGDFVAVTTSNAVGSKIDLFLRRRLDYDVTWDPATGALTATATITLTNDAPSSGLPDYVIGNALRGRPLEPELPRGWNRTFVTLYTPWDSVGATLDGAPVGLERANERGRRALGAFVSIPPGTTRTLVVELRGLQPGDRYRLDLAAQPQVEPEQATVTVRVGGASTLDATGPVAVREGRVVGAFPLVRDTSVVVAPG